MLDKLTFLIVLARERHFRRAAEVCGVSQPTLSAGIKQLEGLLGAALVNRGSRFVGLTPEGERVLVWARRITGDARAMREELGGLKRDLDGLLRLAVVPTALPVAARLANAVTAGHPAVRVQVLSASSQTILSMLADFEIEGGVTYLDNEPLPGAASLPLYLERYRLVADARGPFAGRRSVTWAEVAGLSLCLFSPEMQNRRIVEQNLRRHGAAVMPAVETNSSLVMAEVVGSGRCCSVMPPVLIEALTFPAHIASFPIVEPEVTHSIGLVTIDRDPTTPLTRALITEARRLELAA